MFNNTKYNRIYFEIINNRLSNPLKTVYTETHHIIPRSLGGTDDPGNLVPLSAREHFICHYLLTKMTSGQDVFKMAKAFNMMNCAGTSHDRYLNSRLYECNKSLLSKAMSKIQTGSGNSQYGKVWVTNIYNGKSWRMDKSDFIPTEAIIKGRNKTAGYTKSYILELLREYGSNNSLYTIDELLKHMGIYSIYLSNTICKVFKLIDNKQFKVIKKNKLKLVGERTSLKLGLPPIEILKQDYNEMGSYTLVGAKYNVSWNTIRNRLSKM